LFAQEKDAYNFSSKNCLSNLSGICDHVDLLLTQTSCPLLDFRYFLLRYSYIYWPTACDRLWHYNKILHINICDRSLVMRRYETKREYAVISVFARDAASTLSLNEWDRCVFHGSHSTSRFSRAASSCVGHSDSCSRTSNSTIVGVFMALASDNFLLIFKIISNVYARYKIMHTGSCPLPILCRYHTDMGNNIPV